MTGSQIVQIVRGESAYFPRDIRIPGFGFDNLGQFGVATFGFGSFSSKKTMLLDRGTIQIVTPKKIRATRTDEPK
jgi:hypothetical protein